MSFHALKVKSQSHIFLWLQTSISHNGYFLVYEVALLHCKQDYILEVSRLILQNSHFDTPDQTLVQT
jgi:hypothetical protein